MHWVAAIVAIGALIVVHEAGHYLVARLCKMRVDRFSVGFGPAIWSRTRGDTTFQIAPIPFGGYVQIRGMLVSDEVEGDDPYSYPNRPAWQRFLTIFAGPATNYLFAIVLAVGLFTCAGVRTGTVHYQVAGVKADYDAAGKLQSGDRILSVEGERLYIAHEGKAHDTSLRELVQDSDGEPLALTVLRAGEPVSVTIDPKRGELPNADGEPEEAWVLGIEFIREFDRADVGVIGAVGHALWYPVAETKNIVGNLAKIVTREEKGELTGPVGIASMIKQTFDIGWIYVFEFLMMLNVYLGLFNLFPLPALDGGRLVFLGYEMTTRRRANPKIEATVHMVGILALLLIMVLVTFKDIKKFLF